MALGRWRSLQGAPGPLIRWAGVGVPCRGDRGGPVVGLAGTGWLKGPMHGVPSPLQPRPRRSCRPSEATCTTSSAAETAPTTSSRWLPPPCSGWAAGTMPSSGSGPATTGSMHALQVRKGHLQGWSHLQREDEVRSCGVLDQSRRQDARCPPGNTPWVSAFHSTQSLSPALPAPMMHVSVIGPIFQMRKWRL